MIEIRISEILGAGPKASKRKTRLRIGLIITGFLSIILVFVTIYGQYTGTYLIAVSKDARQKGIAISNGIEFEDTRTQLKFDPLNDVDDILESFLNIEAAEITDGHYFEKGQNYLAYTFYIKNIGRETVNLVYRIRITDDYKDLGLATFVRVREYEVGDKIRLLRDEKYSKAISDSDLIADEEILSFKPNEVRKFTFFVWLDGDYSTPEMKGGAIKMDWVFGITTEEDE